MENHDDRFEKYLREFAPRRPRPLALPPATAPVWRRRLAAATVPAALGVLLVFLLHQKQEPMEGVSRLPETVPSSTESPLPPRLLLLAMTQTALKHPDRLDADLAEASRNLLPNFRRPDSTLRVLAKE